MLSRMLSLRLAGCLLLTSAAAAQTPEATISGIVTDATRGVVPGVTVTAINTETGQRISAVSNDQGFYVLRPVPIGPYVLEAELSGFNRYRRAGLTVTTGASRSISHCQWVS